MKNIIILFTLSISFLCSRSQITYDFSKGEFEQNLSYNKEKGKVNPITNGGFARLKIKNINTFRYKVEITGSAVDYITPMPSELQSVFRITEENYSDQNLVRALALAKNASLSMEITSDDAKGKVVDGKESIKELSTAMEKLTEACAEFLVIAQRVARIKFSRMQLVNLSLQDWKSHSELQNMLPPFVPEEEMQRDYERFSNYYAKAYALYTAALQKAKIAKPELNDQGKAEETIAKAEEQIEQSYNLFLEDNFLKLIDDVVVLQNALSNPKYFEVNSAPIQVDGDYTSFKVKISPTPVKRLLPHDFSKEFPLEIPTKRGLKVDFGVGPAISFGYNSKDDLYYTEKVPSSDSIALKKRANANSISPGIAAMMHFGPRSGRDFRIAFMFGVGAGFQTVEDLNLSLYGGGSVVLGKRERVMVSLGLSYLRVSRLKTEQFTSGKNYISEGFKLEDVTENVFKPSFFIAISYNLTNRLEIK